MTYKKTLTGLIIGTAISVFAVTTALATNQDALFSSNHILFYNPSAPTCDVGSSSGASWGYEISQIVDYKGREILTHGQLQAIKDNKPFYEKSAQKVGIPWEMIAVIHLRESSLRRSNPSNGQGIYQFHSGKGGPYPKGKVSDEEFQRQTDLAAEFLLSKAGVKSNDLKKADDNAVKYTFFSYNGRAGAYVKQALDFGFSGEQASNGEGAPYVMNKADEKRDPDSSPGWGQIKRDNGGLEYPANQDYGAFVIYAALRGKISISGNGCGSSGTIDGNGLSEEDAKKFMMAYGENKNNFSALAVQLGGNPWSICDGGGGSNCVTFSAFFNNAFTDMPKIGYPNGVAVVDTLAAYGVSTGTEPRIFSTFSNANLPGYGEFGHTGIVLGKKSDGSLIVGHASCSHTGSGRGDGTYSGYGAGFITIGQPDEGKTWLTYVKPHIFAYPSNVNVEAIKQFIDKGFVDNSSDTIKP